MQAFGGSLFGYYCANAWSGRHQPRFPCMLTYTCNKQHSTFLFRFILLLTKLEQSRNDPHTRRTRSCKQACMPARFSGAWLSPKFALTRSALIHIPSRYHRAHGQQAYACCREPHCSLCIVPASTKSSVCSVRSRSDHHCWRKCAAIILRKQRLRSQRCPKVRAEVGVQRRTPLSSTKTQFSAYVASYFKHFVQVFPHRVCRQTIHSRRLRRHVCAPCMSAGIHATPHATSAHPAGDTPSWIQQQRKCLVPRSPRSAVRVPASHLNQGDQRKPDAGSIMSRSAAAST